MKSEHEALASAGTWQQTQHGYIHLNYRTVGHYLRKMNYYIDKDVERMAMPPKAPSALKESSSLHARFTCITSSIAATRTAGTGSSTGGCGPCTNS